MKLICRKKPRNREKRTKKPPLESCPIPLGKPLGIHDRNGAELCGGDLVDFYLSNNPYPSCRGRILEYGERNERCVYLLFDFHWPWQGEFNPMAYGNLYPIPLDDGARMSIERIARFEED